MAKTRTYTTVANEWYEDGVLQVGVPATVLRSSNPDIAGDPSHIGGDECSRCHFTYPRNELVYYEGKPYCAARGCSNDIKYFEKRKRGDPTATKIQPLLEAD